MFTTFPLSDKKHVQQWTAALKRAMDREGVSSEQLAAKLGLGVRTLYRRLNGSSEWALSEYQRLTKHFALPPLRLTEKPYYQLQPTHPEAAAPTDFIADMEAAIDLIAPARASYAMVGGELPTFHVLANPTVARFVALMGINDDPLKALDTITLNHLDQTSEHDERLLRIAINSSRINSTEVWGMAPLRPILGQIRMVSETSAIEPAALKHLNTELLDLVACIESAVLNKKKREGGGIDLRCDRKRLASSVYGVSPPDGAAAYAVIAYDLPRLLITMDPFGHQFYKDYVDAKVSLSEPVSGSRSAVMSYFSEIRKQVESNAQTATHSLSRFSN